MVSTKFTGSKWISFFQMHVEIAGLDVESVAVNSDAAFDIVGGLRFEIEIRCAGRIRSGADTLIHIRSAEGLRGAAKTAKVSLKRCSRADVQSVVSLIGVQVAALRVKGWKSTGR